MQVRSVWLAITFALSAFASAEVFEPKLFAFYNGAPDLPLDQQARFLKAQGYAGISQVYANELGEKLNERVQAYEAAGSQVLSVYLPATAQPIEEKQLKVLANHGAMIELTVKKVTPEVLTSIRQTATIAEGHNLKVALYPHYGNAIATVPQALELISQVKHSNLGLMFNLCHFLKSEEASTLERVLEQSGDRLFAVSTCGADLDGADWKELIQTLDQGSFPQVRLFKKLKELGYKGPISLQCYNLKGDREENLKRSMRAWNNVFLEINR